MRFNWHNRNIALCQISRTLVPNIAPRYTRSPLYVGEVLSHNSDGTSSVELPSGDVLRPRGQAVAVGLQAFVRNGEVTGQAPSLPTATITIGQ